MNKLSLATIKMALVATLVAAGPSMAEQRVLQKPTPPPVTPKVLQAVPAQQQAQGGLNMAAPGMPKAPQCAPGFMAKNIQLATTGGNNKYYVYNCERVEVIQYMCNADTSATNMEVKLNNNLPIEGGKLKTEAKFSYACYKPVG